MAIDSSLPSPNGVDLNNVNFAYPGCDAFLRECSLHLPRGSRCLLIGANGAGKTTLLQVVAGKYMTPSKEDVYVLGRPPFFDLQLTCSGQLSYLGTSWRKDVAFAGYGVQLQGDISAGKMIFGIEGVDPARRAQLVQLLDIDLYQRMTTMSDGQRRRVQICMGLLKPYEVLLLDEITVDLDVVGRLALLDFFRKETEERGATIVYATHIFDGLEEWCTHVAYMEAGRIVRGGVTAELGLLPPSGGATATAVTAAPRKLLHVVEEWLRVERDERRRREKEAGANGRTVDCGTGDTPVVPQRTPNMPQKHLMYFR